MRTKTLGLLAAGLLVAQPAVAALIIDTGTPGQSELRSSVTNYAEGFGNFYPSWRAGKFELTDSHVLTGFSTWSVVQTPGQIRWAIYADAGNPPDEFGYIGDLGTLLWSVVSLSPASSTDVEWIGVDGFAVELASGTYWLALEIPIGEGTRLPRPLGFPPGVSSVPDTLPPNPLLAEAGTFATALWPDIGWSLAGGSSGYRIYGDLVNRPPSIPEPGTLALFGLGLAGLGLSRRGKAN